MRNCRLATIPLENIKPHPKNQEFFQDLNSEELSELAESISLSGMLQHPLVCPNGNGDFVVLFGHQRLRAIRVLGWENCEVKVRDDITPDSPEAERVLLTENLRRRHLSYSEICRAAKRLAEIGMSQEEIAKKLGCSERKVVRLKRDAQVIPGLAEHLDETTRDAISQLPTELQAHLYDCLKAFTVKETNATNALKLKVSELEEEARKYMREAMDAKAKLNTAKTADNLKAREIEEKKRELLEIKQQLIEARRAAENSGNEPENPEAVAHLEAQVSDLQRQLDDAREAKRAIEERMEQERAEYYQKLEEQKSAVRKTVQEAIARERKRHENDLREREEAYRQTRAQLERMKAEMEEAMNRPLPAKISQYVSSCLIADQICSWLIGQLTEVASTIEGKAKADPEAFGVLSKAQVKLWIIRLKNAAEDCLKIADLYAKWHHVREGGSDA